MFDLIKYVWKFIRKDATKPHGNPLHVVDKAKNYFVVFNRTAEVADAINQWCVLINTIFILQK